MRLESFKYLHDVSQAAGAVAEFCAGETYERYLGNVLLRSAVERQIGIAGTALAQLRRIDPDTFSRIPDAAQIASVGDTLIVGYANDNTGLVWRAVSEDLLSLRVVIQQLLDEKMTTRP